MTMLPCEVSNIAYVPAGRLMNSPRKPSYTRGRGGCHRGSAWPPKFIVYTNMVYYTYSYNHCYSVSGEDATRGYMDRAKQAGPVNLSRFGGSREKSQQFAQGPDAL